MKINDILAQNAHRPWSLPKGKWAYYQEWNRAIFLHWQVNVETLQKCLPHELEIDLFNGQAWVSLVAFMMEKIRPNYLPSFAPISNFNEVNIRTYVRHRNKSGVYFLSIEGGKMLSCKVALKMSELPYRFSIMRRTSHFFQSYNKNYFVANYNPGAAIVQKNAIDRWLSERYALFQDGRKGINSYDIHHTEWPLQEVALSRLELNYSHLSSLIDGSPDLCHYSPGIQVIAWNREVFSYSKNSA